MRGVGAVVTAAAPLSFLACEGPVGPQGPMEPAGPPTIVISNVTDATPGDDQLTRLVTVTLDVDSQQQPLRAIEVRTHDDTPLSWSHADDVIESGTHELHFNSYPYGSQTITLVPYLYPRDVTHNRNAIVGGRKTVRFANPTVGTMQEPAVLGDTVTLDLDGQRNGLGTINIALVNVIDGDEAQAIVMDEFPTAIRLGENSSQEFVVADFRVELLQLITHTITRPVTRPFASISWSSWTIGPTQTKYGLPFIIGIPGNERPAVGTNWIERVAVLFHVDRSMVADDIIAFQNDAWFIARERLSSP